jgi:nicotinamidase-related amidase
MGEILRFEIVFNKVRRPFRSWIHASILYTQGSFCATDLDLILRNRGIRNIVLAGITTDVCVSTTMREANDKGYECLLLSDCTAATDPANKDAIFSMVKKQGGVFGAVTTSADFIAMIQGKSIPTEASNGHHAAKPQPASAISHAIATVPDALPYPYSFPPARTALVMIDFQKDFMYEGGFGAALGNPVALLMSCLPAAARLLAAARKGGMAVVHTLEAHKPDLSDLHESKLTRGNPPEGMRIGDVADPAMGRILVAGEPGNGIVDEVAPVEGEKVM